ADQRVAVITTKEKSAVQQQEAYQSEETADHASPKYCKAPLKRRQPIPGRTEKFNLFSTLSATPSGTLGLRSGPESVDACMYALYKTGRWRRAQSRRRCSLSGAARPVS